jgi:hypothetical protein
MYAPREDRVPAAREEGKDRWHDPGFVVDSTTIAPSDPGSLVQVQAGRVPGPAHFHRAMIACKRAGEHGEVSRLFVEFKRRHHRTEPLTYDLVFGEPPAKNVTLDQVRDQRRLSCQVTS